MLVYQASWHPKKAGQQTQAQNGQLSNLRLCLKIKNKNGLEIQLTESVPMLKEKEGRKGGERIMYTDSNVYFSGKYRCYFTH